MSNSLFSLLTLFSALLGQLPFLSSNSQQPSVEERLALLAKPSVVQIIAGCSGTYYTPPEFGQVDVHPFSLVATGTGFFVDSNGYILTNAHVVDASQGGEEGCKEKLFDQLVLKLSGESNIGTVSSDRRENIRNLSGDPDDFSYFQYVILPNSKFDRSDPLWFDIKESGDMKPGTGKDVAVIKIQLMDTPALRIGDSNTVNLQEDVIVIGYPAGADNFDVFDGNSIFESTVTDGKVSNVNKRLKDNSLMLQIDTFVEPGSSGSPVLNQSGEVIGMITFGNKVEGRITPFAIRTSGLFEYVSQAGIDNEEGKVNGLYRQGLEFLWKGDYEGAKAKFEAVQGLFPQHSEIQQLITKSEQARAEQWDNQNYTPWVLGLAAVTGLFAGIYWFKKKPAQMATIPNTTEYYPSEKPKALPIDNTPVSSLPRPSQTPRQGTVYGTDPYVELKNQQGQKHYLYLRDDIHKIGRDADWSDIDIPDYGWEVISRHHATLQRDGQTYRIFDGDQNFPSRNGVFVSKERIDTRKGYLLKNGDQLLIGGEPHNQVSLTYYNPTPS